MTRTTRLIMVLHIAIALVTVGLVPSAITEHASAAGASSPELVPFIGNYRISATWGAPSGGYHASSDEAIDFELPSGTPVYAAGTGSVISTTNDGRNCNPSLVNPNDFGAGITWCINNGYVGISVKIQHPDGRTSLYLHLSGLAAGISPGAGVSAGQQIGMSGNSGISTGPHLHYQEGVSGNSSVDPGPMIGCVNGTTITYDNMQYRYHQYIENRSFSCSGGGGGGGSVSLTNGGFESGNTGWGVINNPGGVVNRSVWTTAGRARSGTGFLEANTSVVNGSVGQDTSTVPVAGQYYSARVWVKDPTGSSTPFELGVALWALGGTQEMAETVALVGSEWMPIDVVLPVTRSGHSALRIEFYMRTTDRNINFDDTSLSVSASDPNINSLNPTGRLDSVVSSAAGTVTVSGWAYDPNSPSTPIDVHVYVGGQSGQAGAVGYNLGRASVSREDVRAAYPWVGASHGFEITLPTSKSGSTVVCAYGINLLGGNNALLPGSCITVWIGSDLGFHSSLTRLVDTRPDRRGVLESTSDEFTALAPGEVRRYTVGTLIAPAGSSLLLNTVVVAPVTAGNLVAYPCASVTDAVPSASMINFQAGVNVANNGIVGLNVADGGFCIRSTASAHVVIDSYGWFQPTSTYTPLGQPQRLLDSREGRQGILEAFVDESSPFYSTTVRRYHIAGIAGVPISGAVALAVNVTAASPFSNGEIRLYPCTSISDPASVSPSVLYRTGVNVAGGGTVTLSTTGDICVRSTGGTHVVIDLAGYYTSTKYRTFAGAGLPTKLLDTRSGFIGTLESSDLQIPLTAGMTYRYALALRTGFPTSGSFTSVRLTVTEQWAAGSGNITVWACSASTDPAPTTSLLNYRSGVPIGGSIIVPVAGSDSGFCLKSSQSAHITLHATHWFES